MSSPKKRQHYNDNRGYKLLVELWVTNPFQLGNYTDLSRSAHL